MNPIPLNDRGQFRYADFMTYIPEFLREEPDVVELVQLMSDYINDAYRNIEDVEEFEFKLCVAEAKVDRAMRKLGTLREMFNLASGRGERVSYLSVPRANVKSNEVFGRDTGYTPYYVDVPYDSVREEISNLSGLDYGLASTLSDGDVVFARYAAMDPVVTRAYYYSSATGTLLADPEGSSQDPFTGTYNTGSRCISFKVDDISSVTRRFGYMDGDGNSYFEVFFTARVSDVRSDPATVKVHFDVDRVTSGTEGLTVDYYGLSTSGNDEYRVTMGFYGEDGWKWKSGFPSGMFYLRESSGAKLVTVGGSSSAENVPDPALAMEASKYSIVDGSYDADSGIYEFITESALPVTDGGRFYLVRRSDGKQCGELVALPSNEVSARYATRMRASWTDIGQGTALTDYFLLDFPLFYDKGVPDFSGAQPTMSWEVLGGDVGMDWGHARVCRCAPRGIYGEAADPYVVATVDFDTADRLPSGEPLGRNQFLVPYSAKVALVPGMRLYSCGTMWSGLNTVSGVDDVTYVVAATGKEISGALVTMANGIDKSSALHGVELYDGYETVLRKVPGTGYYECGSYIVASLAMQDPESPATLQGYVVCRPEDGTGRMYAARVTWAGPVEGHGLCIAVGDGELPVGVDTFAAAAYLVTCDGGSVDGFESVKRTGERGFRGVCGSHRGDVYTDAMYYAYDTAGGFAMLSADTENDVLALEAGKTYSAGDVVYDPDAGRPYRCIGKCVLEEDERPSTSPYFRDDPLTGAVSPYAKVYNRFIPYYGPVKAMEYGETVDYSAGTSLATTPLYVTKVVENRLKYGWEHREFLNYGTAMDLSGRQRNGSVDIFSSRRSDGGGFESSMDAVTATLDSKAVWTITYPVMTRGCTEYVTVDIDGGSVTATEDGDWWAVSARSAGHGLSDGYTVRVDGLGGGEYPMLDGYWKLSVPDGDNLEFRVSRRPEDAGKHGTYTVPMHWEESLPGNRVVHEASVRYVGMYMLPVLHVGGSGDTVELVTGVQDPRGLRRGRELGLVDRTAGRTYGVEVVSAGSAGTVTATCAQGDAAAILAAAGEGHSFHLQASPADGDYVLAGERVYLVGKDAWQEKERYDLAVPCTLFSRENLVDTSETNPGFAMGDEVRVESITLSGTEGVAIVRTKDMLPHFTRDNAEFIEGRTMVRISGAVPACYNGWHTVVSVMSPKAFTVGVCYRGAEPADAIPMNGGTITLREGRWYSYSVEGVDWDKVGNRVTFSLDNTIDTVAGNSVTTAKEHGLEAGDLVVVGPKDYVSGVDAYSGPGVKAGIRCYRVSAVDGKFTVTLEGLDGSDTPADANMCIARGVVVDDPADSLGSLRGEYSMELASVGGRYRFRNGDIVVALAQENPCEVKAWRVVAGGAWEPVRKKRSLKVSALGVDEYRNGEFDGTDAESGESYMKYATYSDVDVATREDAYVAGFRCVRNARFSNPALPDMDTTRNPAAEYSSAEDYSNVSPRQGMKASFRGVPGMKYPLVEKIERLCYLRDASVIDYDFIGYLARFFGYDITPMGDDVAESPLYRTRRERELAVRETVSNLPQYYSLGGTKAGLHMLFSTFGVISEALTLWTDATDPYGTMITRDEVVERLESGEGGQWVPTPYIDIAVTNDAKYPQFTVRQSDIARLKEQIRVFKPINVVFRDFLFRLEDTMELVPRISISGTYGEGGLGVLSAVAGDAEPSVDYADGGTDGCPA